MLADTYEIIWLTNRDLCIPTLTQFGAFPMDTHAAVAVHDLSPTLVLYLTLYHTLVLIDPMMIDDNT